MRTIAFATHAGLPDLDPDDRRLVPYLTAFGIEVRAAIWNDPDVDWTAFELIVLRSCWDYDSDPLGFGRWIDRLDGPRSRVRNPAHVLRWNLDKTHLRELDARGVAIVPTTWVPRGSPASLASALDALGATEAVVKPTISFSAHGTWRTSKASADEERWRAQVDERALMVQRFMPEITTGGEWSLVFLGGRFSHASLKHPAPGDFRVQEELGGSRRPVHPDATLVTTCERILAACPGPHLYARVDGVLSGGEFLLMEVELIDPTLYLADAGDAPRRFAEVIQAALPAVSGES